MAPTISNTDDEKSSSRDKNRGSGRSHWLLTVAYDVNGSMAPHTLGGWFKEHCEYASWQLEVGEGGLEHYQCAIKLFKKQRLEWLKRHFLNDAHCEISDNIKAADKYAHKTDTRILGPWFWPEPAGRVKDKFLDCIPKQWQTDLINIIKSEPDDRKIHWRWEPTGGCGKTTFAKHLVLKYNAFFAVGGKKDVFHAYDKQQIVILDIPRSFENYVSYDAIEQLKNGMLFSGKYNSQMKIFNPPHLIIFANFPPNESALSADRWDIVQL